MKFAIASDLHLEFERFEEEFVLKNTENADVLILAGDILLAGILHDFPLDYNHDNANGSHRANTAKIVHGFFRNISKEFPKVIMIAGNHEHYSFTYHKTHEELRKYTKEFDNIVFLENESVEVDGVLIVGSTLWTNCKKGDPSVIEALKHYMNDFTVITYRDNGLFRKFHPMDSYRIHLRSINYIDGLLALHKNKPAVVVTHHAPSYLSIHERYRTTKNELLNYAYYSDLSERILDAPNIKFWLHGHTHDRFDYMVGDTRVIANPRGYKGTYEEVGWHLKFFEI